MKKKVLSAALVLSMALALTPAAALAADSPDVPAFTDVAEDSCYAGAIAWAVAQGITNGTSDTTFSPDATCTVAQIITFLWRAEGEPEPTIDNPYSDVTPDDYYYKAAVWAYEKCILWFVSDGHTVFGGDTPCTRAMAVTYMWRLAGWFPYGWMQFDDVPEYSEYTVAVSWAVQCGITYGTSSTTFSPHNICTRAQIVTFLYRAIDGGWL